MVFPVQADSGVAAAQRELKEQGLYRGASDGNWNNQTSASIARYQIREGLEINGELDRATQKALGLTESPRRVENRAGESWKILREQDAAMLDRIEETRPSGAAVQTVTQTQTDRRVETRLVERSTAESVGPVGDQSSGRQTAMEEWLSDYIGAYVIAGLAPNVDAELQFFADKVDYFGTAKNREAIRKDLESYNARYPERRFWLAGKPRIVGGSNEIGELQVEFPLRYEVRGAEGRKSGEVIKSVSLERDGRTYAIVSVNERKRS